MTAKQHYFVSNRNINIGSTSGHSIRFKKGVPCHVPRLMHKEVLEKGCIPCDAKGTPLDLSKVEDPSPKAEVILAPEDATERADAIMTVIESLVERNNPADFTAGGVPSATAVTAALKWKVDAKEIRPIWSKFKSDRAEAARE